MQLTRNTEILKNIITWLFYLLPLSMILGNFIVNLNIVLFITFSIVFIVKNRIKIEFNNSIFLFLLFSSVLIISSFVNEQSLFKSLSYLRFTIFFVLGYLLIKEVFNIKKIFFAFSVILLILCLDLIIQHVINYNILGQINSTNCATSFFFDERVAGSFVQNFCFFLVFTIFELFKNKNNFNLIVKGFLISLITIALLVTFQRMPMVVWCFFLIIYGAVNFRSKLPSILISFLFLTIFILSNEWAKEKTMRSYGAFINDVKSIITQSYTTYNINIDEKKLMKLKSNKEKVLQHMANSGHGNLFGNGLTVWRDHKIIGIGYKNFYAKCVKMKLIQCSTHPHNIYLDVLLSTGIVGLITLLFFLINIFVKIVSLFKPIIHKNLNIELILIMNFLMYFFPLKSTGSFFTTTSSTYMMMILIMITSQLDKKKILICNGGCDKN